MGFKIGLSRFKVSSVPYSAKQIGIVRAEECQIAVCRNGNSAGTLSSKITFYTENGRFFDFALTTNTGCSYKFVYPMPKLRKVSAIKFVPNAFSSTPPRDLNFVALYCGNKVTGDPKFTRSVSISRSAIEIRKCFYIGRDIFTCNFNDPNCHKRYVANC